jgi:hypothetical protein
VWCWQDVTETRSIWWPAITATSSYSDAQQPCGKLAEWISSLAWARTYTNICSRSGNVLTLFCGCDDIRLYEIMKGIQTSGVIKIISNFPQGVSHILPNFQNLLCWADYVVHMSVVRINNLDNLDVDKKVSLNWITFSFCKFHCGSSSTILWP